MKEKLKELLKNAYVPYIDYRVSSAVETEDGSLYYGVNVQLATMGGSICAERNAIYSAHTDGHKKFKKLYVMVESEKLAFPCFLCRQTIAEFFDMDADLILMNDKEEAHYKMSDIIVHAFSKEDLKWNRGL